MEKDAINKLNSILSSLSMPEYGVVPFSAVENHLLPCRAIKRIPQNAKSIIIFAFPYRSTIKKGNISSYAQVKDYHPVVLDKLKNVIEALSLKFNMNCFEAFCDNSPIPEVKAAALCSLGVIGKNGLLITKDYGSYVFLGEIVTDLELSPTISNIGTCLECGLCLSLCPGNAISNGVVNKENCASNISQKKNELTVEEQNLIIRADTIWGCDICQDCCPMNKASKLSPIPDFKEKIKTSLTLDEVLDDDFIDKNSDRAFLWRGKKVLERNLRIISKTADNNTNKY